MVQLIISLLIFVEVIYCNISNYFSAAVPPSPLRSISATDCVLVNLYIMFKGWIQALSPKWDTALSKRKQLIFTRFLRVDMQLDVFSCSPALQEAVCRLRAGVLLFNFIFQNHRLIGSVLSKLKQK